MKYVFIIVFITVVLYATFNEDKFEIDYENASAQERTYYLNENKSAVKNRLNGALRHHYGLIRDYHIRNVSVQSGSFLAELFLKGDKFTRLDNKKLETITEQLCKSYAKSEYSDYRISITVSIINNNNMVTGRTNLTNANCRRFL